MSGWEGKLGTGGRKLSSASRDDVTHRRTHKEIKSGGGGGGGRGGGREGQDDGLWTSFQSPVHQPPRHHPLPLPDIAEL